MSKTTAATRRFMPAAVAISITLWLGACASQPDKPTPPVTAPQAFTDSGETPAPTRWWTRFDDPALDQLVTQAQGANLDLKATFQRLEQAQAMADIQAAGLFPSLNANAGAQRRKNDDGHTDSFTAGLSAEYELDLWGRIRSQADAEQFRVQATEADYRAAALSLAGSVARTWFQLLEQRAQKQLAQQQLQTNRDVLSLIESRFATGQSASADVLRQRQLVTASEERLLNVEAQLGVLSHQLAVLLGETPTLLTLPAGATLPTLPPLPDTGVPANLVQRRPDLQQAYYQLRAADEDLAAAISNRFPRLTLSASVTSEAGDVDTLFNDWLTTLAGNLVMPLIDGGRRRAEVQRNRSLREQRLYQYGQATLTAFQDVEDALLQERQQHQRIKNLEQQQDLANTTYQQLRLQYLNGAVSYIDVLSALQDRQSLRRTLISARRQRLGFRVALYQALAGDLEQPMTEGSATP